VALLVNAYVAPSSIAGMGVFAAERIPKGTRVWEFTPGFDLVYDDIARFHPLVVAHLTTYCYRIDGKYVFCADHAKFFNHADDPSCGDDDEYTFAARDIEAGEELTSDYRRFGVTDDDFAFNTHGVLDGTSTVAAT
jgi:uncharacterized protein